MNQLKIICHEQRLEMPSLNAVQKAVDGKPDQYADTASWPAMGGVLLQASVLYSTAKEARQAAARECMHFWLQQKNDHRILDPAAANAKTVDDSKVQDEGDPMSSKLVPMVINLIDNPDHIEFNAEVTAAQRVSDGALLVVDAVEGKSTQTDNVLRQALREGVVPVLMINKVDRRFVDSQLSPKNAFDRMNQVVDDVNAFIAGNPNISPIFASVLKPVQFVLEVDSSNGAARLIPSCPSSSRMVRQTRKSKHFARYWQNERTLSNIFSSQLSGCIVNAACFLPKMMRGQAWWGMLLE